jgi:hypothetical protein
LLSNSYPLVSKPIHEEIGKAEWGERAMPAAQKPNSTNKDVKINLTMLHLHMRFYLNAGLRNNDCQNVDQISDHINIKKQTNFIFTLMNLMRQ